jgi:hypothetical protein
MLRSFIHQSAKKINMSFIQVSTCRHQKESKEVLRQQLVTINAKEGKGPEIRSCKLTSNTHSRLEPSPSTFVTVSSSGFTRGGVMQAASGLRPIADNIALEKVYADVKANEPGTKLYQIGVDPKNTDIIWLWEEVSPQ